MPTVLIVDDHPDNIYMLQVLLAGQGYDVVAAADGAEALQRAAERPPSLVISDVLMPVMDGFRLCRAWKQHPDLRAIPFVFYTATYTDPRDEQLALSLGADAFIVKPAEPDAFLAQIGAMLAEHRAGALRARPPEADDETYTSAYNTSLIRKLEQKSAQLEAANRSLRASEGRLRAIGSATPDVICVLGEDGRVAEVLSGHELLRLADQGGAGRWLPGLLPPTEARRLMDAVRETIASGRPGEVELSSDDRCYEASVAPLAADVVGAPAAVLIARDVTHRRIVEKQLQQAQKMEAIGRLTAGIAHDFNNLLTVINGYSGLMLDAPGADAGMRQDIEEIQRAGEQAAALTRRLLAFSRKQVLQMTPTDLNLVVRGVEKMLRRVIGEDVQLVSSLAPALWTVTADPSQIEQVLVNLAVNARDAMAGGGRLTITTRNVALEDGGQDVLGAAAGDYVLLAVSDDGQGMSDEVQGHIFEPFFTTKPPGLGTGLGLSVVYGIVTQLGGHIAVSSAMSAGTTLRIYLPRAEPPAGAAGAERHASASPLGHETVLLVEDDAGVRHLARQVLASHGYQVLEAGDGAGALRRAAEHGAEIHLLVSDVVLPDRSGPELARQLAPVRPGMRVLLMSGYTTEVLQRYLHENQSAAVLAKPFSASGLAHAVRAALDAIDSHG